MYFATLATMRRAARPAAQAPPEAGACSLASPAFELRYQLRNPVFWVVAILFFLLTFGATTIEQIQIGSGGNVHVNAPAAIAQIHLILSIFFMFVTTAFVANVIVRDDESGFGPMVQIDAGVASSII